MNKIEFMSPTGENIIYISLEEMMKNIIENFSTYWSKGSGDGSIAFYKDNKIYSNLMIEPNEHHGIYLFYENFISKETWISVYDKALLYDTEEAGNDVMVSVGLFVPKQLAWEAIKVFLETGERAENISWELAKDMPEYVCF